jgi:hypothetical protein
MRDHRSVFATECVCVYEGERERERETLTNSVAPKKINNKKNSVASTAPSERWPSPPTLPLPPQIQAQDTAPHTRYRPSQDTTPQIQAQDTAPHKATQEEPESGTSTRASVKDAETSSSWTSWTSSSWTGRQSSVNDLKQAHLARTLTLLVENKPQGVTSSTPIPLRPTQPRVRTAALPPALAPPPPQPQPPTPPLPPRRCPLLEASVPALTLSVARFSLEDVFYIYFVGGLRPGCDATRGSIEGVFSI